MRILKSIFILLSVVVIGGLLFSFIASFSFQDMYYNKKDDSLIVLKKKDSYTSYTYSRENYIEDGKLVLTSGGLTFYKNDNKVGTCTYNHSDKCLKVTAKLYNKNYNDTEFRQVDSIVTYLKAIF